MVVFFINGDERFAILEASKLISRYKKADDAGYKKVKDVTDNQQILLTALATERSKIEGDIILDGHICMLNAEGRIECIPEEFVTKALINGIVLLQDNPRNIVKRQSERDGRNLPIDTIRSLQEEEIWYCEKLFSTHAIPYSIINGACDYQQFCEKIDRM